MTINQLTVFAQNGEKNTTGLTQADGFPSTQKPARQWFNWLFNAITGKVNELVDAQNGQLNTLYPVGIILEFAIDANPNTIWPNTTWVRFAEGKVTVGYQDGDTDFGTIGQTGGEKKHQLTEQEMPAHIHNIGTLSYAGDSGLNGGGAITASGNHPTSSTGQNQAHNNLQPYIVTSKWRRTA